MEKQIMENQMFHCPKCGNTIFNAFLRDVIEISFSSDGKIEDKILEQYGRNWQYKCGQCGFVLNENQLSEKIKEELSKCSLQKT